MHSTQLEHLRLDVRGIWCGYVSGPEACRRDHRDLRLHSDAATGARSADRRQI